MADITPPTIVITTNKTTLKAGDTALITFTLSEVATDFVLADIAVTGGTLSNFSGSGMVYSANFIPSTSSSAFGSVSVGNFKFSDETGNANIDGLDSNNRVSFIIDTAPPTISISADRTFLGLNETATLTFTLSEPSSNFDVSDIFVTGGTLTSFKGFGANYSVIFTPNSTLDGLVSVGNYRFTDVAGNFNTTSSNSLTLTPFDPFKANVSWTRSLGTSGDDVAFALTTGADGSIYVGGYTNGPLDDQTNSGGQDAFVTKYSADGKKVWTRLLGTGNNEIAFALTTGLDGSIYVGVSSNVSLDLLSKFNPDGALVWTRQQGTSGFDKFSIAVGDDGCIYGIGYKGKTSGGNYFVSKYSTDGTIVWTNLQVTSTEDKATALTIGTGGSIFVSGFTSGSLDGQPNSGQYDAFIAKYKSDGTKVWTRLLGTNGAEFATTLSAGIDGSIFISGYTTGVLDGQTASGGGDAFIAKYSPDGTRIWTRQFGTNRSDSSNAMTMGLDGSIYVSGRTLGIFDEQSSSGQYDAFIAKYTQDGTRVWTRQFGTSGSDDAYAITTALDGSIYISGQISGSLDGQRSFGNYDAFVMKLTTPDTSLPTIEISSSKVSLLVGESADLTITLSKASSNLVLSDFAVQGGTINNFLGSGSSYSATFKAGIDGTNGASVSLGSGKFSDALGIFNEDGADANNKVTFTVKSPPDTTPPTIAVTSNSNSLSSLKTALLTFTLSEFSTNFSASDVNVLGGTLSNFSGSGTTYTAVFTPLANSNVKGAISVASGVFTDTAGNPNTDGSDTNNTITLAVDTVVPTIALSSAKSSLIAGDTTTLTFTLSEASTTFTASDVTVTGGALANFTGSGTSYSALFTPIANSTTNGTLSVASGVFTDTAGNANADGADANNLLTLAVDTLLPTIAVSSNKSSLQGGDAAILAFTLSEISNNFVAADITVTGGTLSSFAGSGNSYTAIFKLISSSALNGTISVANGAFTDVAGNKNTDGSDSNNSLNFTRLPTVTNEIHTLSVIVDKNVLGASATLLKELKESITLTNGVITKHLVEYAGLTFDYDQIDSLITTVTRDGEFTAEFTREINDYLGAEQNITYSAAVAIVGVASIDGVILSVAGADGNYVG